MVERKRRIIEELQQNQQQGMLTWWVKIDSQSEKLDEYQLKEEEEGIPQKHGEEG